MLKYRTLSLNPVEAVHFLTYCTAHPPPMFKIHSHRKKQELITVHFQETHGEPLSFLMRFPHTKATNLQESILIVCIVQTLKSLEIVWFIILRNYMLMVSANHLSCLIKHKWPSAR